jgi:peptide chain release factor 1
MFQKLEKVEKKFDELHDLLQSPEVIMDHKKLSKYAKEHSDLKELIETYREYKKIAAELSDLKQLSADGDSEMAELAKEELPLLEKRQSELAQRLKILLLPKDPNDGKNIMLEIRAGIGGEEAGLFAADLFRMYSRFAEEMNWRVEVMTHHPTGVGGFKEIIAMIEGRGVYSKLKYESGVHRVQRVPVTESSGRIHTSAVTVAVLPEAEDVEVAIRDDELQIDVYRAGGHGGQSVNTTDSAVRITHLPTNTVVICQDEKSQHKNKAKALRVLKTRLYERMLAEQQKEIAEERKGMIGSGDRSEKIRTYNFRENRVTDHRIGLTLYCLDLVLNGALISIVDPLITHYQTEALKASGD